MYLSNCLFFRHPHSSVKTTCNSGFERGSFLFCIFLDKFPLTQIEDHSPWHSHRCHSEDYPQGQEFSVDGGVPHQQPILYLSRALMHKDGSIPPEPNGRSTILIRGVFCTGLWPCSLTRFSSYLTNGYMKQNECHDTRVHLGLMEKQPAEQPKTTRHRLRNL